MSATDASPGGTTINFPGPPAFEQRRTTPGQEVTRSTPGIEFGVLSPEQEGNLNQSDQLAGYQNDTAERQREQQAQADQIEAEHQRHALDAQNAISREKADRDQALQKDISTWQNRLEQSYKAAQEQPSARLFADGSTGENAMRAVGLALAGLGDMMSAGANARYGTPRTNGVGDIIEADLQRQREKIAKLKDNVLMAKTGVQDAQEARRVALAEIDAKGAGFMARLGTYAQARLSALKAGDEGTIAARNTLAEIQQKKLEYQQRSLAPLTEKHQTESKTVKNQGTTVEETTRDAKPAGAKDDKDIVMGDPLNPAEAGKPLGGAVSGRGGAQAVADADIGGSTAVDALKALAKHIKDKGESPTHWKDIADRKTLRDNAIIQVAAQSSAGQNEMAMEHEAGSIGAVSTPGLLGAAHQWLQGDNPDAIARKIHDIQDKQTRNRGQKMIPLSPYTSAQLAARQANAPAVSKDMIPPIVPPSAAAPATSVPPAPAPTTPPTPRAQYVDLLKRNPGLRKTAQGRKAMGVYNITEADLGR